MNMNFHCFYHEKAAQSSERLTNARMHAEQDGETLETAEEQTSRLEKIQALTEELSSLEHAYAKVNPPDEYCEYKHACKVLHTV
jgi:hypothetical protein